tara:strand:- start:307 stop:531 length:225 start_codon:yes stop_codon:yes gene_type:complete
VGDNISTGMGLIILAISIIVAASILKPNNQQEEIYSGRYELENGVIFDTATGNSWDCVGVGKTKCQLIVNFSPE